MCKLYFNCHDIDEFIGYKVVAKKDGKYYSVSMGFEYCNGERIPVVQEQNLLIEGFFLSDILNNKISFSHSMLGRTCAFVDIKDAKLLATLITSDTLITSNYESNYETVIVKVRLTCDIMTGYYGSQKVYGGRRMTILEEIDASS